MAQGRKTGGRRRGTPNKVTRAFKDAVRIVYDDIGGHAAFAAWARENPTEFYKIAARLIPAEVNVSNEHSVTVIVDRGAALEDAIQGEWSQSVPTLPQFSSSRSLSAASSNPAPSPPGSA